MVVVSDLNQVKNETTAPADWRVDRSRQDPQIIAAVEDIARQLQGVGQSSGFGSGTYELVCLSQNWVFRNRTDAVLARVMSSRLGMVDIERQLALCLQLARDGLPIVPPASMTPVQLESGCYVTFWPLAEVGPDIPITQLAQLAQDWHRANPPDGLSRWDLERNNEQWGTECCRAILDRLRQLGMPEDKWQQLRDIFERRYSRLRAYWNRSSHSVSLIHGDFWYANIVRLNGRLVLCDPDAISQGPREKDLAAILVNCHRYFAGEDNHKHFWANYHLDYDRQLLDLFFEKQEINDLLWLADLWDRLPASRVELIRRLDNIDDPHFRWVAPSL